MLKLIFVHLATTVSVVPQRLSLTFLLREETFALLDTTVQALIPITEMPQALILPTLVLQALIDRTLEVQL